MVQLAPALLAGLVGLAGLTAAHPGHDVKAEAAERASFLKRAPAHHRGLKHCAQKLRSRGYEARNVARRELTVERLRRRKGLQSPSTYLKGRDLEDALNTDHHSSLNVDQNVDPAVLFASNATCILGPDTTQGPYYVTGELIRKDITDNEPGVPLYLDFQIIDTNTCNPVPNIYLDAWHCNATGVYSGVVAKGNGDINDKSNIDATFGRGVQKTDSTGVAQFETIFPGHYTGRTHHIHLLSHAPNGTSVNANHTLSDLRTAHASYVSQVYFDQDLIYKVEETAAYVPNKQPLTTNAEDYILREEAEFIDPFMQYVYLGDSIDDGLFAWISLGIDGTKSSNVAPAVWYTENGGVENPDFGGEGPGGPPPA